MKFKVSIRKEHFATFQRYAQNVERDKSSSKAGIILFICLVVMLIVIFQYFEHFGHKFDWVTGGSIFIVLAVFTAYFIYEQIRTLRRLAPSPDGVILGEHLFTIEEEGLREASDKYDSFTKWKGIKSIDECEGVTFLFLDTVIAHIIPHDTLESDYSLNTIVEAIKEKIQHA